MRNSIWVICIEGSGNFGIHSKQLIYKAQTLKNENASVISAICMGNYDGNVLQSLATVGADEVIYINNKIIHYRQVVSVIVELFKHVDQTPQLIICPATEFGRCVAADLAIRIGAGLTAECIDITLKQNDNEYQYVFTRAAINSTVLAQIECINTNISMCTCKENAFVVTEYYPEKKIPVHKWGKNPSEFIIEPNYILHSEYAKCAERNIALENSNLVFGIGRGVRNKDDLNLIKQVAQKHNAMIAGTRAVVEEGMIDKKWQVGQSGISISPKIYVAIGISGATQHIVGIKNAKKVIAINTDENASIFAYADYCIIDDYKNILNELL